MAFQRSSNSTQHRLEKVAGGVDEKNMRDDLGEVTHDPPPFNGKSL